MGARGFSGCPGPDGCVSPGAAEGMVLLSPAEVSRCACGPSCGTLIACLQILFGELLAFGAGDCLRRYMGSPGPLCPVGATQWRLLRPLAHVRLSGAISLSVRDVASPWPAGFWWRPTLYVQRMEHERETLVLRETEFVGCLFAFSWVRVLSPVIPSRAEAAELPQAFAHPDGIGCLPLRP